MDELFSFFVTAFTDLYTLLGSMVILPGVTVLGLIVASFIISLFLGNFLLRAKR